MCVCVCVCVCVSVCVNLLFVPFQVVKTDDGLEAIIFTAQGDMRQVTRYPCLFLSLSPCNCLLLEGHQ